MSEPNRTIEHALRASRRGFKFRAYVAGCNHDSGWRVFRNGRLEWLDVGRNAAAPLPANAQSLEWEVAKL